MKNSYRYKYLATFVSLALLLTATLFSWAGHSRASVGQSLFQQPEAIPVTSRWRAVSDNNDAQTAWVTEAYGRLPLGFEANHGQADPKAIFVSRRSGSTLFLTQTGAVFALANRHKNGDRAEGYRLSVEAIRMNLVGSNPAARIVGAQRLQGNNNYFRGKDPNKWLSNVPTYSRVQYQELYPGIDLVYYGNQQQVEYDFQVTPGYDPSAIKLAFEGAQNIKLDATGDLVLRKAGNEIRMHKPSVYQEVNDSKQPVAGRYVFRGPRQIGFEIGEYDKTRTLVIDPVLTYSTYLGGTDFDEGRSVALDSDGNAFVTGRTFSFNFPTTIDSYDTTYANSSDLFVTKLNADGSAMVYSSYLGGLSEDNGFGIAIDSSRNAYITGSTSSNDYPTTSGAFQTTKSGGSFPGDAFVTKLNADGTGLVYSTYLGGTSSDQANGIDVDSEGNAYVTGYTNSSNFPPSPGAFQTTLGGGSFPGDAFVTKINSTGTALVYSTYLGGLGSDQANGIKVDASGNAYVTGTTLSADFDVTPGAYQTTYGGSNNFSGLGDAFVTKLNPTGTALVYSTYLGGAGDDGGFGIDLADSGEVYVTGSSTSVNFPTTPGVVRVGNGGVAKTTDGAGTWAAINSGLTNSTETSLAFDPSDPNIVFVGSSGGGVFKSTNGGANWAATNSGLTDLVIRSLAIDPTASSIMYLGTSSRGVFRSTDHGATWRAINTGENGASVNALKIDPASSSTIYAGTEIGIFKTTNGGANWTASNTGLTQSVNKLSIDPVTPSTVYAGLGFGGVFKSTNGGANWSATGLTDVGISALVVDPSVPSTIYAGTSNGALKSTDSGSTWSGINVGMGLRQVNDLAISPADNATIYAGTGVGVFKSTNGGGTWGAHNKGLAGAVVNVLAIDPAATLTVYSGSASGNTDAYITKLNFTGTGLDYSTFLGGSTTDQAFSIAVDQSGNAFVTGSTSSQNFPTTKGLFEGFSCCDSDAFVTKLNPTATDLIYSTHLGGTSSDGGFGIVVDSAGSAYVAGTTQSQNFPTTAGAFQPGSAGFGSDAFISKLAVAPSLTSDLAITMTGPGAPVAAGQSAVYNITVTNNGPDRTSSVVVSDELPPSLVFNFCSSPFSCSHAGNNVSLLVGSLDVGASASMTIFANVSCSIENNMSISNTATVDASANDPNPSNNSAQATFTATNPPATLSPTAIFFGAFGGSSSVSVTTGSGCAWTAMSNANWITITFSSNCCNGFVNYSVAPNPGVARTGTMTIDGQTFTVNQASGCTFLIDHTSQNFISGGGSDSVAVTASDASCNWNATANDNFIIIAPGAGGNGNGSVNYSVASNPFLIPRSGTMTIAGNTFTVTQAGAPSSPQFQGFHDGAGCNTIQGWAWDPNNPNATVIVDILDGTTLIGSTPANMYREDLLNALGSPNHGFSFLTPPALKDGAFHFITVRFSGTNTPLANTGRPVLCILAPSFFGRHDGQGCNAIEGWAWDANDPGGTVNVDIYDGTTLIGTVAATLYRQDLADVFGSPYHGFIFKTPASLKDGQPHTITIKFGGTNTNLPLNTPRTTSCISSTPDYQGSHDIADCNTISGFAWDANDDQGTINVAIYIDGHFGVVVPAQQAYPGVGTGFHGFKFAVPPALKNGLQHSIQVRFSGTPINLSNTPKTITCPP